MINTSPSAIKGPYAWVSVEIAGLGVKMEAGNGGHGGGCVEKIWDSRKPDRLFRACPRYRKGSHCNYFKWVDDDEYEVVGEGGTKKDYGAGLQVESDYDEWRLKVAWRLGIPSKTKCVDMSCCKESNLLNENRCCIWLFKIKTTQSNSKVPNQIESLLQKDVLRNEQNQ
ncbi:hypothetical protein AHAS_Ahas12G0202700 [Arachis hypogaea]